MTGHREGSLPAWTTAVAAVVAVGARLPFLGHVPGPDESGFLLVGAHWNGPGSSLYGNYFVDRPPLLISVFRLAATLGGLPALRVIGCVAVALVVLGCGRAARLIGGDQAGRWAAVTAAALCLSPLLGGYAVNGELLAAPFVVGGVIAVVLAVRAEATSRGAGWAALAGTSAVCAVLVKQNFADVLVFGSAAFVLAAVGVDISRRRFAALASAALVGGALTSALLAVWTVAHGTSLRGVFDAMYPFRVQAGQVIAAGGRGHSSERLSSLGVAAVAAMVVPLMAVAVVDFLRRRHREPMTWAMLVLLLFATASVLVGGNYWHHYLLGLVVPVSILAGLLAADRQLAIRPVVGLAVASATVAWAVSLALPQGSDGETVGTAVARAARPTDSIVNLYGQAEVVQASGLSSPYEHLWSLPVKTLDPRLTSLDAVLVGPDAPTWLVTGPSIHSWGLSTSRTRAIIRHDYRKLDTICGRTVFLRDGAARPTPRTTTACRGTSLITATKESLS